MYQLPGIIMINRDHSIFLGCHTRAKSILNSHMNFTWFAAEIKKQESQQKHKGGNGFSPMLLCFKF